MRERENNNKDNNNNNNNIQSNLKRELRWLERRSHENSLECRLVTISQLSMNPK